MEHKIPLLININCFFNALNVLWHFKRAQCGGHFFFCRRQFLASSKGNRTVYILYWVCALNSSSIEKCRDLMCAAILVWRHSVSFYLGICRILCRFFLLELFYLLPTRSHFYHLFTRNFLSSSYSHFLSPSYSHFFILLLLALVYALLTLSLTLFAFFSCSYSIFYSLSPCTLYLSSSSSHSTSIFIPFFHYLTWPAYDSSSFKIDMYIVQ